MPRRARLRPLVPALVALVAVGTPGVLGGRLWFWRTRGALTTSASDHAAHRLRTEGGGKSPVPGGRVDEGFWIAVLPFKSGGGDLEALAEGLSEGIVTGLSRFSCLQVIAPGSTLRYTGTSSDVRAIGKELGARYVMEGSLRQSGSALRAAVQLVDASTGAHLWAETYDRTFSPEAIFDLQDDLVARIVSTSADHFGYHFRLSSEEHLEAREALERAVEQAPSNGDCWAMLSWVYSHEYAHGFNPKPDSLDRALAAAGRAVDLAPSNHLAQQVLAVPCSSAGRPPVA